jgi:hypothetical protein
MSKGRPRTRIDVLNRQLLASVLREVVDAEFGGGISAAAQEIGLERSLLGRILSQKAKTISHDDLRTLRKKVSQKQFIEISRALYPAAVAELIRAFDKWVSAERDRILERDLPDTPVGRALRTVSPWETQRLLEYQHLLDTAAAKFPDLIESFDDFLERRKHFQSRGNLAYLRVFAPLLDATDSGHVERGWRDLTDDELRRFVQAGMEREHILLDRTPDPERAQEISQIDPVELFALYGQQWDRRAFKAKHVDTLVHRWLAKRSTETEEADRPPSPSLPRQRAG